MSDVAAEALAAEVVFVALLALFSAAEAAIRVTREPRSRALAAMLVAEFFTTFALAAVGAAFVAPRLSELLRLLLGWAVALSDVSAVVVTVGVVSIVAIVLGLFLPRAIAARHPAQVLAVLAWPIHAATLALGPVVGAFFGMTRILARPFNATPEAGALITEAELKALVETGEEQGVLEEEEREMIHSIFAFGEKVAHELMVPRTDIVGIAIDTPAREALDFLARSGHSRIPLYERDLDDIIGIVYVKDVFRQVAKGRLDVSLRELARPAHFVPETKKVADLLREMQRQKVHLAIVVDEYGGTAGLVTIEDLIEEIVGEIRDEFEVEEERIVPVSEHEALMDARVPFDEVRELFGVEAPESEEYDTLGGFIVDQLGRVPRTGDVIRSGDVTFRVETVEGHTARRVRVKREAAAPAAER